MGKRLTTTLLLLLLILASRSALLADTTGKSKPIDESREDLSDLVKVTTDKTADHGVTVWATNLADFPVTVRLDLPTLDNLKSSAKLPASIVVQPRKKTLITRLSRMNARQATRYAFQWTYHWGWRSDKPDNYVYTLPYKSGYAYRIGQGFNGPFSHQGKNALDFGLPEGATICAARGGTVIEVIQHNTEGGISDEMRPKANRILILHDDGSIGRYAHLTHNGARVKVGQKVQAGDEIGLAGSTGFAQGPHLHFEIDRPPLSGNTYETVAMQFAVSGADGAEQHVTPKEGTALMRPFATSDAKSRWPLNAIDDLKLCRSIEDAKPKDITDAFRAGDTLCITMLLNLPPECTVNMTIAPQHDAGAGAAGGDVPSTQPVFNRALKCDFHGTSYYMKLNLADFKSMRAGRYLLTLACEGKELASKAFTVGD
jgi:murein DD-endopeptidase MepM/ murein hydrolase activator NlpD